MKVKENSVLEKMSNFLTVENIKYEIMRTAYGNPDSILNGVDARALIIWYLGFCIVPWFFYDLKILIGLFILTAIFAVLCKVSPLIIGLMAFGVVTSTLATTIVVMFFGGNFDSFLSLMTVTLKLLIVSLATISIFTSMDPEELGDALRRFGLPAKFCFSISYGYRVLPMLIDEYNAIFNSFRLRGMRPTEKKYGGLNIVWYYVQIVLISFYPMLLNTAKRVKVSVEALETKGFSRSLKSRKVMRLKSAYMKFTFRDLRILGSLTLSVVLVIVVGKMI